MAAPRTWAAPAGCRDRIEYFARRTVSDRMDEDAQAIMLGKAYHFVHLPLRIVAVYRDLGMPLHGQHVRQVIFKVAIGEYFDEINARMRSLMVAFGCNTRNLGAVIVRRYHERERDVHRELSCGVECMVSRFHLV